MGSCLSRASMGGFANPRVTEIACEYKGFGLTGVSIEAIITILNPNFARVDGTNIAYKIRKKSDGTLLAEGDVPREFSIEGGESKNVSLPVTFKYMGMGAAGASIMARGETEIVVSGDITFVASMAEKGTVDIPFKGEVTIVMETEEPPK